MLKLKKYTRCRRRCFPCVKELRALKTTQDEVHCGSSGTPRDRGWGGGGKGEYTTATSTAQSDKTLRNYVRPRDTFILVSRGILVISYDKITLT